MSPITNLEISLYHIVVMFKDMGWTISFFDKEENETQFVEFMKVCIHNWINYQVFEDTLCDPEKVFFGKFERIWDYLLFKTKDYCKSFSTIIKLEGEDIEEDEEDE